METQGSENSDDTFFDEASYVDPLDIAVSKPALTEDELKTLAGITPGHKNWRTAGDNGLSFWYYDESGLDRQVPSPVQPTIDNGLLTAYVTSDLTAFVYGGTEAMPDAKIMISTDQGTTWKEIALDLEGQTYNYSSVTFSDDMYGYIRFSKKLEDGGSHNVFFRSTDRGNTWEHLSSLDTADGTVGALKFSTPEIGFARCNSNAFFHTYDGGKTWSDIGPDLLSIVEKNTADYGRIWFSDSSIPDFEGRYGVMGISYTTSTDDRRLTAFLATVDYGTTWFYFRNNAE